MSLGPRFHVSPFRAPNCAFCIFGCGLLFGLWSYHCSSSLVPLPSVFPLFVYLSILTFRVSFHYVDVVIVMHHILS